MHHLTAIGSSNDNTAVVVELGNGATGVGVVACNRDCCADDGHQLAPVGLVGAGVVLELLVDVVEGVELGHEDVGAVTIAAIPMLQLIGEKVADKLSLWKKYHFLV